MSFFGFLFQKMEKELSIIIYNNTVYQISEEQYERLSDVIQEAKSLPFAGELHLEEHSNFKLI